jgi:SMI1 / KNR4 family (SUKH-1)
LAEGLEHLLSNLRQGEHETYPVATEEDLRTTEEAIGQTLPDSYSTFVRTFSNGAYLYLLQEVSAVGQGNPQIMPIHRIDRISAQDRRPDEPIPFREGGETTYGQTIPFGLDHNAGEWCFIAEGNFPGNEYPVAYLSAGCEDEYKLYGRLVSFTEWLTVLIEKQEEVIRTLYDEDVIYDELCLG